MVGDTLVHGDLRADNLLLRRDGSVAIVDWPWASIGPAWLDTVLLSINVRLFGGDAERVLAELAARTGADPRDFTDVLVGAAGYFLDAAPATGARRAADAAGIPAGPGRGPAALAARRRATGSGS